ncbi:MAG: relaxase/mobilization nuclease domain-containing protein [Oscillospiraceae bacterium]
MKSVMRYVSQTSKTLWDGQQLVSGIGCQPETAFDEFLSTKLLHRKDGGVMFYHMVQSFPKCADIDPCAAHEAARQLAGYFEGCEVLVCTHTDREHIHSHCIINSVNFETGRKVHMADEQIQELRVRNDEICEELGLPKFQKDEQRHSRGMSNAEYYTASKGESWKFELMRVIDECMRCAGSREEFLILLRAEGYDATWTDSRKNITYTTPEGRKCRDSKLHIEKYLKENMETEFGYRTENDNTGNVGAAQKLMDEAQRLEPSVMVTERNWSALLEMQDRLFRQQMQLDANLKTLLTREDTQETLTEMQMSAEEFSRQAGSLNEKYSSGCTALTETTKNALTTILNDTKKQLSNTVQETRKKIRTCAWISITAVILCAALCALAVLWSR